jgi:hypothetical protein
MKKLLGTDISGSYVFAPAGAGSGTITFSGLPSYVTLGLQNILLITNTTANTIIYNFADSTTGAVSFSSNVLTLDASTTGQSASDKLQIYLDLPSYEESLHDLLRRMNKLLESNATVDQYQRQKVVIEAVGNSRGTPTEAAATVPVSGTVTASVSGATTLGISSFDLQYAQASQVSPYDRKQNNTMLHVVSGMVDERWLISDRAHNAYANLIRSKLSFS